MKIVYKYIYIYLKLPWSTYESYIELEFLLKKVEILLQKQHSDFEVEILLRITIHRLANVSLAYLSTYIVGIFHKNFIYRSTSEIIKLRCIFEFSITAFHAIYHRIRLASAPLPRQSVPATALGNISHQTYVSVWEDGALLVP